MLGFGFIFTQDWNGDKLWLWLVSFFTQTWNMGNYAWVYFRMAVSFFHKIETWEKTMLGFGFIFTQACNGNKMCLKMVSFLHKLEMEIKYDWDKFACPQHHDSIQGTCPPSFMSFT